MPENKMQTGRLPELLCPAGSPLALDAAIEGGADAVYLGGLGFNARMNASNFDREALIDGIRRAHAYGVKVYLTLNTQVYDRELSDYLRAAAFAQNAGADALIVADLGGAAAIHRVLPDLALHASTQACAHSAASGEELAKLGFSR
ncbi:MAG: U32 family peptidase, partial [Clostridia bacterium]|nr:U32 family peptidase [Clostridia bacterium]